MTENELKPIIKIVTEYFFNEVKDIFPCRKAFSGRVRGRTGSILIYGLNSSREEPLPQDPGASGKPGRGSRPASDCRGG
jgi:hypothetical protein